MRHGVGLQLSAVREMKKMTPRVVTACFWVGNNEIVEMRRCDDGNHCLVL